MTVYGKLLHISLTFYAAEYAEAHSTKKIAHTLKISVKTVETHRMQLMERMDIHDITGLVRYAIWVGLVEARPIAREQRSRGARSFSRPSQVFPDCFFD